MPRKLRPTGLGSGIDSELTAGHPTKGRCSLRTKVRLPHSLFFDVERASAFHLLPQLTDLMMMPPPFERDTLGSGW